MNFQRRIDDYIKQPAEFSFLVTFETKTGETAVEHGTYPSREQRDEAMVQALVDRQYDRPRWWQFWRYDEKSLPKDILERFRKAQVAR